MPFLLRTGKRMAATAQRVSLILREPPGPLAGQLPADGNVLIVLAGRGRRRSTCRWWPSGRGRSWCIATGDGRGPAVRRCAARDPLPPYVRLIHDVLIGDRSLFTRPDGLAAVWKVAGPLLTSPPKVAGYPAGSWGPAAARKLVAPGRWLLGQ